MSKKFLDPGVTLEDLGKPETTTESFGRYSCFISHGCLSGNRHDDKQYFIDYVRKNHSRKDHISRNVI